MGREGAFGDFTIAIFNGIARDKKWLEMYLYGLDFERISCRLMECCELYSLCNVSECPLSALRGKGFSVVCNTDEQLFAESLAKADEAWIISGMSWVHSLMLN